ncbi:hypothetical protein ACJJTC_017694 [Scirpophaga incertulas]
MSVKRTATTELNHDNWDQDDQEHEEMGAFKTATKDVLEKRVIRTAKRRTQVTSEEGQRGVFSGFSGFNKNRPSSFDFLSNLTNGNKLNGSPSSKSDAAVTSNLFSSKASISSSSIFGMLSTPTSTPKASFGSPNQTSSIFSAAPVETAPSVFATSKADSTVGETSFKIKPTSSSTDLNSEDVSKPINVTANLPSTQVTSTLFGMSSADNNAKSLFSSSNNISPFLSQPVAKPSTTQSNFGITTTVTSKMGENDKNDSNDDKKLQYYAKLKGLNESVSEWIKKHVDETPLCILTPIFQDYERYLKEMQQEYHGKSDKTNEINTETKSMKDTKNDKSSDLPTFNKSPFSKTDTNKSSPIGFGSQSKSPLGEKSAFSFGVKPSESAPITTPANTSFSFGINKSNKSDLTTSNISSNGNTPFSFGTGKPFSFGSSIQKPATEVAENGENEEEEEPPKVEFVPIVEENSVYDKKCKIFAKIDGNFVEKGLGTLYIKKVEETGKHQLLIRANNSLGNVLLNLILVSSIPTQRMGKNNVMMVCIPTPEAKPPPTPHLIRVKTSEEADELLETLNKYKT